MISDFVDNVEIQGKEFRFQTSWSPEGKASIQTVVLLEGKVLARRRMEFGREESRDLEVVRSRMLEQHKRIFEMFVVRIASYQSRDASTTFQSRPITDPPLPLPANLAADGKAAGDDGTVGPPSAMATPGLVKALRARRFFTGFALLLGEFVTLRAEEAKGRLQQARRALSWMTQSALFIEIRMDEQVRCHLIKEDIDRWLAEAEDFQSAQRIWSELAIFMNYLLEINHRMELVTFDEKMLRWAVDLVRDGGMTEDVLEQLAWLYGLLPQLNRLLENPKIVSDSTWVNSLNQALTLTDPHSTDRAMMS